MSCKVFKSDFKPDFLQQRINKKIQSQRDKTNVGRSHTFFFKSVWSTQPHKCFECDTPLPVYDKRLIHHLIEKCQQKKYTLNLDNTENGRILCLEHHDQCRWGLDKLPNVKQVTGLILKKYEQFKVKSL